MINVTKECSLGEAIKMLHALADQLRDVCDETDMVSINIQLEIIDQRDIQ